VLSKYAGLEGVDVVDVVVGVVVGVDTTLPPPKPAGYDGPL
jgi:hypothetical protein